MNQRGPERSLTLISKPPFDSSVSKAPVTAPAASAPRSIVHVDLDCFYVSVERVLNPSLENRPVIVGGSADRRGVVCSASREARERGVHSGMATAIARSLCPDAIFLPGRGRIYARASAAAMKVLGEYTSAMERASIDEAHLDVTDSLPRWGSPIDLAASIQRELSRRLGLPASVGIGTNKLVAKVACGRAKPAGIVEVWPGYERAFLAPLSVDHLPGVGPVMAEKLRLYGLKTVDDVARVSPSLLQTTFGPMGWQLAEKARGLGGESVVTRREAKSIGRERTLPRDVSWTAGLIDEVHDVASEVSARLRREGKKGRSITLKLKTAQFQVLSRVQSLKVPTDRLAEIAGVACHLLEELHDDGTPVRLVGVSVGRLGNDLPEQRLLFPEPIPAVPAREPVRAPGRTAHSSSRPASAHATRPGPGAVLALGDSRLTLYDQDSPRHG